MFAGGHDADFAVTESPAGGPYRFFAVHNATGKARAGWLPAGKSLLRIYASGSLAFLERSPLVIYLV